MSEPETAGDTDVIVEAGPGPLGAVVSVRLKPDEAHALRRAATGARVTMAEYVRQLVLDDIEYILGDEVG